MRAANKADRIFVVCPAGTATGGHELLHQLVHQLRAIGRHAYISYWPFDQPHSQHAVYGKYNAPVRAPEDCASSTVVLPEVLTQCTKQFRNAHCVIWWLSVDNYFGFPQNYHYKNPLKHLLKSENRLLNPIRRMHTLLRERRPLWALRGLTHYTQSHYARNFLDRWGIRAEMLTDYLSDEHFEPVGLASPRLNVIAYNPKKGIDITRRLIAAFPEIVFRPIENMTPSQVATFLRSSKVYIDFGHHPGKDRPPREAVMAGCCVITGLSGAAAFAEDVPIDTRYRMDPYAKDFERAFAARVRELFDSYDARRTDFDPWRERIRGERALFEAQVVRLF